MIADSKFKITSIIRQMLIDDEILRNYISVTVDGEIEYKIYPIVAPEGTAGDFIVYYREQYSKKYTKMGVYEQSCLVALAVISDDYDSAQNIADRINTILDGKHPDYDIQEIQLEDSTEHFEEGKYMQILLFNVK